MNITDSSDKKTSLSEFELLSDIKRMPFQPWI